MPDLPEILVLRHGETVWNREGRMQGWLDSDLTELGRAQASAMGAALGRAGVAPGTHSALTSPLGRARETARIALGPLRLEAVEEPGLAEIGMGEWSGQTRAEIGLRWPGAPDESLFDFYARCPGGEGLDGLADRVGDVLGRIDRPTVLVTHGITLRVLVALALGRPASEGGRLTMRQGTVYRVAGGRLAALDLGPADLPAWGPDATAIAKGG